MKVEAKGLWYCNEISNLSNTGAGQVSFLNDNTLSTPHEVHPAPCEICNIGVNEMISDTNNVWVEMYIIRCL